MDLSVQTVRTRAGAFLRAIRPRHWVKNSVVVAAPLFGLALTVDTLLSVAWAFAAFSLTASAFYLINDVRDVEKDRQHPVKQHRPIAAGRVPIPLAVGAAAAFLVVGIGVSVWVEPLLAATLGAYAIMQAGYNLGLKQQPIVDIMIIAGGFVLRALAGAAAAQVPVSEWFILCVGLLAFFLGVEKRRAELESLGADGDTRTVMEFYTIEGLRRMESVVTAAALMAYALWTIEGAATPWMLATLPFVAYAIFRYQNLSEKINVEAPEDVLLRDPGMITSVFLWGLISLTILIASS